MDEVGARRWDGRKKSQFLGGPLGNWGGVRMLVIVMARQYKN